MKYKFIFFLSLITIPLSAFENLEEADYHVTKGYRTCIACHVYRGDPGSADPIISCNNKIPLYIRFRSFPGITTVGGSIKTLIDFIDLGKLQTPNIILAEPVSGLNIKDFGWDITADPKSNGFNYWIADSKDSLKSTYTATYTLKAPLIPGSYDIEAGMHGAGCFKPYKNVYIRKDEKTINVIAISESIAPVVLLSAAVYAKTVAVRFSEPVQKNEAEIVSNYTLTRDNDNKVIALSSAVLNLSQTDLLLTASDILADGEAYTLTLNNLKDYAETPNPIAANTTTRFTVQRRKTLSLEGDMTMDGKPADRRMHRPQVQFLGRIKADDGSVTTYRSNILWDISPLPPGEVIQSAKLIMFQSDSSQLGAASNWDLIRLGDTDISNWNLVFGPADHFYNGLMPGASAIATTSHDVQASTAGAPKIKWEWDITSDFTSAYSAGEKMYALRIKLQNEANNVGVKLFSNFYKDRSLVPKIELILDHTTNSSSASIYKGIKKSEKLSITNKNGFVIFHLQNRLATKSLKIVNLKGNLIWEHPIESLDKSNHNNNLKITWNGRDKYGSKVQPGLYIYHGTGKSSILGKFFFSGP